MRFIILITLCFSLFGCNSIYLKPGTLDKSQLVYAPRGGYSMQRTIKQTMEERGYNAVNQLSGYLISGDPAYISSHNNARSNIQKVERYRNHISRQRL